MRVRGRHFLFGSVLMCLAWAHVSHAEMDYPSVWHCDDAKFHWYCDNEPDLSSDPEKAKAPKKSKDRKSVV